MNKNISNLFKKVGGGVFALIMLLVALIATNVIIKNMHIRKDLTGDKRFSLSEGTKNTMAKLEDNVELQFYFSRSNDKVPMQIKTFANQTEDFLREYVRASKGKIKLTIIDPKPDTDEEDMAEQYNLKGLPLDMYGAPLYMGLVAISGKYSGVIPIIDPQKRRFLEYDISRLIYQVTHPEKPVIGVLSSLPVLGSGSKYPMPGQPQQPQKSAWYTFNEIKKDFDVREVKLSDSDDTIPADISTLIVVHPKDLSDNALYAIDQFVLKGGHLITFVDPSAYSDETGTPSPYGMPPSASSDLGKLFKAWGVGYDKSKVIVDRDSGMQIREGNRAVMNYAILNYNADNINKSDPASANLNSIRAIFAGALTDNTSKEITVTPLITTSSNSGTTAARTTRLGSEAMNREYKASATPQVVAMKLSGNFKTAFPKGKPASADSNKSKKGKDTTTVTGKHLVEGKSTVVICADVDMLADITNVEKVRTPFGNMQQPVSNNGTLLENLIAQLSGDQDLIDIRGRADIDRSFTRVVKMRKAAQLKFEDKINELKKQLQETEQRINQLQMQKGKSQRNFLTDAQRDEINKFNKQKRTINKQMRQLQKNLRSEIDSLGTWIKCINIILMPVLVILFGMFIAIRKNKKQ